jgi:abortive infection bacteriophage resistance protein
MTYILNNFSSNIKTTDKKSNTHYFFFSCNKSEDLPFFIIQGTGN